MTVVFQARTEKERVHIALSKGVVNEVADTVTYAMLARARRRKNRKEKATVNAEHITALGNPTGSFL